MCSNNENEYTQDGITYTAIEGGRCEDCVFHGKGNTCRKRNTSIAPCVSVMRKDGRGVIFVKKGEAKLNTNGDYLRKMSNQNIAHTFAFFARWLTSCNMDKEDYAEYMLKWLNSSVSLR